MAAPGAPSPQYGLGPLSDHFGDTRRRPETSRLADCASTRAARPRNAPRGSFGGAGSCLFSVDRVRAGDSASVSSGSAPSFGVVIDLPDRRALTPASRRRSTARVEQTLSTTGAAALLTCPARPVLAETPTLGVAGGHGARGFRLRQCARRRGTASYAEANQAFEQGRGHVGQFQPAKPFSADRILTGHCGLAHFPGSLPAGTGRKRQFGLAVVCARFPPLPFEGCVQGSGRSWHETSIGGERRQYEGLGKRWSGKIDFVCFIQVADDLQEPDFRPPA
jgi:hypothetical protein